MKIVRYSEATQVGLQANGREGMLHSYLGQAGKPLPGPQAFISDKLDAGSTVAPHFHDVDQFQIFVRGDGRFGPAAVDYGSFHYADAFTPYGPIVGGDDGVAFFTIRAACSGGYFPMPESRAELGGKPGRNISGRFVPGKLPHAGEATLEAFEQTEDGMKIMGYRIGAGSRIESQPIDAGAQYHLVMSGSLTQGGAALPPLSLIWLEPGEAPVTLEAGPDGAEVLLLQMPRPTARRGSDPSLLAGRSFADYKQPAGYKRSDE